ncbi:hypothetical protein [Pseudoroseomonas cervicalis]|uniref:hypothetical protein n=1 Tax=Teichococcus cervicalis TaxID=204525 RepID=UPI0022F161A6|nr:hypothetical protein [Pseudoroseomonas cervicalis]WBV41395.1 hypothetical protein PFY06_09000 [Pseudoroseomonas cervicalis]
MPNLSIPRYAPSPWTSPSPPMAPPSWRIARPEGQGLGGARAGRHRLPAPFRPALRRAGPALRALPWKRLHRLAREVMLGAVIGIGGGWAAARLAIAIGL